MKLFIPLFLSLLLLSAYSYGQQPFTLGIIDKIESTKLAETRVLNIYLPPGYEKDTATYPVIYLLDGSADEDYIHIVGLVQFLTMIQAMPNSIVVGIANVDRKRDFTFPTQNKKDVNAYPTTGHSATFISFLESELQPYIQQHYHTNGQKTIVGQSLGGLLATEILLKKPGMFNNYIIISPSLWWNDESLLKEAPGLLKNGANTKTKVYVSVGSEGKQMENDAKQLSELLKTVNNKNLTVDFVPLPRENHLTILHNSAYKAFELQNKKP